MKKFLPLLAVAAMLLSAAPARATVFGIEPGDLIKLANDHDPATHEDEVVYYYDKDWQRHAFPNLKVYQSWYKDFSGVKELTPAQMAEIRLSSNVTYRPGTRLVKIASVPKVYAVEPGGVLRWVETEAVAKGIWGKDWAQRVDDVPEAFFTNYREGAPLTSAVLPTGTVVKRVPDGAMYVIEGMLKRRLSAAVQASLHLDDRFIIQQSDLSAYDDSGDVAEGDWKYKDTSQLAYIDTPSPPEFDFPVKTSDIKTGIAQDLAAFRVSSGVPLIIHRIRLTVSGPLWNGDAPNLTGLRLVDGNGESLFGSMELSKAGASSETLTFSGAYTMPADAVSVVTLSATPSAGLPPGSTFSVFIDRDGFQLADGGSGNVITEFSPKTAFPVFITIVK